MDEDLSMQDKIRANAELVVSTMREKLGVELAFDSAGVEWIDGYINRQRGGTNAESRSGLVDCLGSFVGECIIRTYGGEWVETDGTWGVRVNDRLCSFPFAKVEKQFANGPEDSVASFFSTIPHLDKYLLAKKREDADSMES